MFLFFSLYFFIFPLCLFSHLLSPWQGLTWRAPNTRSHSARRNCRLCQEVTWLLGKAPAWCTPPLLTATTTFRSHSSLSCQLWVQWAWRKLYCISVCSLLALRITIEWVKGNASQYAFASLFYCIIACVECWWVVGVEDFAYAHM